MINIYIYVDDLKVRYITRGSGSTVLILPGWNTTIETYMPLVNIMANYCNVYTLDMPGFGKSDSPSLSWNLDTYVEFIKKFIRSQGIKKLSIIGHSNGGRIIIKLLNKGNLEFKVEKLILIGSAGIVHNLGTLKKIYVHTLKFGKKIINNGFINSVFPNLISTLKNNFGSEDYKKASPLMKNTLVNLVNENLEHLLTNIYTPTLLIWGTNDKQTPISDAYIMEKLIPNCALIKIDNCSHYVFLECMEYVNIIIKEFLTGGEK